MTRCGWASPTTSSQVRVCASHGGLSLGEDGASHQMVEDIALMRAMPRMQVIVPADYNQAYRAVMESYDREGPLYMRFGRPADACSVYEDVPDTLGGGGGRAPRRGATFPSSPAATWCGGPSMPPSSCTAMRGTTPRWVNVAIVKPLASEAGAAPCSPVPGSV